MSPNTRWRKRKWSRSPLLPVFHSAARVSTESLLNAESVGAKIVVRLLLLSVPTQR